MSNNKIFHYMVNTSIKSLLGLPYRGYVKRSWQLDRANYLRLQQKLFEKMYAHAIKNVPYYRGKKELYPVYQGNEPYHEFIKRLPIITKETLRDNNECFVSRKKRRWCTTHTTSGTSGTPITLYGTPFERALSYAITHDWYRKLIVNNKYYKLISLSGFMTPVHEGELYWSAFGGKSTFLNIYGLKEANADRLLDLIQRDKNILFFGYASALAELARVVKGRLDMEKNNYVAVSTSEILTLQHRSVIEANLCRKVYDQYGSQEGCHLILECDEGKMHVHPYVGVVEILNDDNSTCQKGQLGRVIVTGFKSSMPLIRYEIGDMAIALDETCSCGLSWPTIGSIEGRSEDLVLTADGRRIGYLNFHSTKNLKGIAESQLIQNGYYSFTFKIVLMPDFMNDKNAIHLNELLILSQLKTRIGYDIDVAFEYLERIPREGGRNKFKSVIVKFN